MNKTFKLSIVACAVFACSAAFATGTPDVPTSINTSSESSSSSHSVSQNTNGSTALVNSSTGDSNATVGNVESTGIGAGYGGAGGAGGSASSSATGGDSYSASKSGDVSNRITNQYLSLPQPVWTSVPTPYGCLVTEAVSGAFGFNFVSGSKSKQFSDAVCTTIRMAEAATLHCQFETAAYLNKAAYEKMYEGQKGDFFLASKPYNLSPVACDLMKRPTLRMAPTIQSVPVVDARSSATIFVDAACTVKPKVSPGLGLKKPAAKAVCK